MLLFGHKVGAVWPWASLGLLVLPLFAVLIWWRLGVRDSRRAALGVSAPSRRATSLALAVLPPLLLCVAAMRPYVGSETFDVPSASSDYMLLVDVSRSMFAKDVSPSRIEIARRKMVDLIRAFTKAGVARRFGVTVFAGGVYTICPLTDDTSAVLQFIENVSPELVTSLGSNMEQGVTTSLERLKEANSQKGRLLLISDGEDNRLSLERIVSELQNSKVRVDVLGVGTPLGSPIELPNGRYVRDKSGSIVHSKLNEESLKLIAKSGNGTYVRATITDQDVDQLVAAATPLLGESSEKGQRQITSYREVGSWMALGALLLMLAVAALHRQGFALTALLVVITSFATSSHAQPAAAPSAEPQASARDAFELYSNGEFSQAVAAFRQALATDPGNRAIEQGLASALFKTGQYPESQQTFRKLADTASDGREYFENTYNEGNAFLAMGKFPEAIEAYSKALDVKPGDERASHNRDVARRLLEEAKRATASPTSTPTVTPPSNPSAAPSPSAALSPSAEPSPSSAPSPAASPSSAPSAAPSPSGAPTAAGSPSPSASGVPTAGATPSGSATGSASSGSPEPSGTPQPTANRSATSQPEAGASAVPTAAERRREAEEHGSPTPFSGSAGADPAAADLNPSLKEAETWLKSLPDAPLLLRRDKARRENPDQTW